MNDLTGAAANHAPSDSTLAQPMIALAGTELHLASASGNVNILRGIDLTVARGEKVGVVGPSGPGKSSIVSHASMSGIYLAKSLVAKVLGVEPVNTYPIPSIEKVTG